MSSPTAHSDAQHQAMLRINPARLVQRCVRPSGGRSFSSESRDWFGIDAEYISKRGLGIAKRVLNGMPEFVSYSRRKPRVFVSGSSDEARSSMYVLSQFPMETSVDLPQFVQGAERAAHTVLQRLYTQDSEATKAFLEQLATPESLKALMHKPSAPVEGESKKWRSVLEQLSVNTAALEAVEYTRERVEEDVTSEWLTLRVQYDVTEHLLISPENGEGIEDRRAINTRFAWTFEADVTKPDELEWGIVAATPFEEKPAVITANEAQKEEEE
ncbi:hypothetical protein PHYPSEUDO_012695 [Phytophthora pseudosyringae]|uniref:Uncharacterized protein n=1 Tax=Phytophthora pseudosyringae TaxID=221518 RepID=A0A8T1VB83_9STRA|nr:hypothetical protein PHYPSEUDO_012695 [Phytophthora pseudosyringae]